MNDMKFTLNRINALKILTPVVLALVLFSCDVLQQAQELYAFSKCKFRLNTINNITVAGVNVQEIDQFSDLNFMDAAKLTAAVLQNKMPLDFILDVETKNPNNKSAALNKLDWILFIDDIEMTRGTTNQRVEIPANGGVAGLPLHINVDLFKALSGETKDAILNFGMNLAGQGDKPTRVMIKAKPTVYVGGKNINYPGYINIKNDFTSGGSTSSTTTSGGTNKGVNSGGNKGGGTTKIKL
jgi:LEA14-like dessication related protein